MGLSLYEQMQNSKLLTLEELLELNEFLVGQIKHTRKQKNIKARSNFSVGDRVGFGERGSRGKRSYKEGSLHAIKRTRAQVRVQGVLWTVPLNMLQAL
jgi:hypothetical protein